MQAIACENLRPLTLVNDAALALDPSLLGADDAGRFLVAGSSRTKLALAHIVVPGAGVVWTDFSVSASVRSLLSLIEARGGLDRLVLAGTDQDAASSLAHLSTILTLLPALRRRPGAEVVLSFPEGPALRSLKAFLRPLAPRLRRDGLSITWHSPCLPAPVVLA
jgi:hypothetical protein